MVIIKMIAKKCGYSVAGRSYIPNRIVVPDRVLVGETVKNLNP